MIIAGTGHRPPKLGGYCNRKQVEEFAIKFILDHIESIDGIISGGALGWDQAIAVAAIATGTELRMYLPFKDFDNQWPPESRDYLEWLCSYAAEVKYICEPGYAPHKMQVRNEAMVDACDILVCLWNGKQSGTRSCIYYAQSWRGGAKKPVNLWSAWQQFIKGEDVTWPELPNSK